MGGSGVAQGVAQGWLKGWLTIPWCNTSDKFQEELFRTFSIRGLTNSCEHK